MKASARTLLASALAALAGGAAAAVTVNGADVSAGSGDGWALSEPDDQRYPAAPVVRLTGPGPFVVSGTDETAGTLLRAEADCTVVASNLVLSAAGTGIRARRDGFVFAAAVATNGAGQSVAAFANGLFHSAAETAAPLPEDPAAAYGSVYTWADAWKPSNVSWTPHSTNTAAVAWAGERFVAARFRGGFMVSEDGAEWRAAAFDGDPDNLRSIARNPVTGTLAATSTKGIWTSRDNGLSWKQATNHYAVSAVWKDGAFVAVGHYKGTDSQAAYWSEDDGATWRAKYFSDQPGQLEFVIAGGKGRFLAGGTKGWRFLLLKGGDMASVRTDPVSASKFAAASGGDGSFVACAGEGTGLRETGWDDTAWRRWDVPEGGTFPSVVFRGGRYAAEGVDTNGAYSGTWYSLGGSWVLDPDEDQAGWPVLDCGAHAVKLAVAGTGNRFAGGLYAPAVRIPCGGSLDLSAAGAGPAVLDARGGRIAAAFGEDWGRDVGSFVQRGATLFAAGGAGAPDIGPAGGPGRPGSVTILGGSLRPANGWIDPPPSNGVEAVRCVVVGNLAPGEAVELANLPGGYGTDGIAADGLGRVYLWLPESAESFRFIAGGSLRRVAAGGGEAVAEELPGPKVESAAFAPAGDGALEVTLRVSSPVEAEALAPAYASDLSALAAGGGERLAPSRVEQVSEDEYEVSFRLPGDADSGFLVIRAK